MPEPPEALREPALGLYVHLPWCARKCPYCDFNSHAAPGRIPADEYAGILLDDLKRDLPSVRRRTVTSIYFGGGTPSLFSAPRIERLVTGFEASLQLEPGLEITLEANPGALERDGFEAYKRAGINRVSLGVQSFDDGLLRSIGRIHDAGEARRAIESLHRSGVANFNIDLMYGLPGQTPAQARADLDIALEAEPAHLSHYQLSLEPGTVFAARPPSLPDHDACWAMYEEGREVLEAAGFLNYEISAWSRPGLDCAHNLNYWRYGDFLGIGAGAHAKLSDARAGTIRRLSRQAHPWDYMKAVAARDEQLAEDRLLGPEERIFEFFLNRLRLREGFTPGDFASATGVSWERVDHRVHEAVARGLLERHDEVYRPTAAGWRFNNDLQLMFLP